MYHTQEDSLQIEKCNLAACLVQLNKIERRTPRVLIRAQFLQRLKRDVDDANLRLGGRLVANRTKGRYRNSRFTLMRHVANHHLTDTRPGAAFC
jgi:hypothetical protein